MYHFVSKWIIRGPRACGFSFHERVENWQHEHYLAAKQYLDEGTELGDSESVAAVDYHSAAPYSDASRPRRRGGSGH
jgi:hypothetical protein